MACCTTCELATLGRIGVWPSDVDREKARLDPSFIGTDGAVQTCTLPADVRAQWTAFYMSWRAFRARETPLIGAGGEWDLAEQYASDLQGWQSRLRAQGCVLGGPDVQPQEDPRSTTVETTVKVVAAAAIVVAIVYGIKTVIR